MKKIGRGLANGEWTKLEGRTLVNEQHVQYTYCIAKNSGRKNFSETNVIHQYSISRFAKLAKHLSYCRFANVFLAKTLK